MFINKNLSFRGLIRFTGKHLIWLTIWAAAVTGFIEYCHYLGYEGFKVPWLPLSIVGTAVAFYVGFKNNSAYDRLWEARKIWGGVVNVSRMWGANVKGYVTNIFRDQDLEESALLGIHRELIYRHIAYLYVLRKQLLAPTPWEHISQNRIMRKHVEGIQNRLGIELDLEDGIIDNLRGCLGQEEFDKLMNMKNTATQMIDLQSQRLKELREQHLIDDFRHMELQKVLNEFYTLQGKAERIKKFPLPRQYGGTSVLFVGLFLLLLPFGMVTEFHALGDWGAWISIPFTVLVGWVYVMMELIGDYSENPFEGLGNDIPMKSLCRIIEIDLREMLGETDLPPAIEAKNGVLM